MKHCILIFAYLLTTQLCFSQAPEDRYQTALFADFTKTEEVLFSTAVPQPVPGGGFYEWLSGYPLNAREYQTTNVDLYMDIYEPAGDTLSNRPVIVICFGGGFLSGSKDHWSIVLLCEELARRGFVTAAIDYRLGMNIFDADLSQRAVYRGLQDARSAVRFFRADANSTNTYKVDPNKIFVGGHSSGAFMAIHNAYLDKESERPISTFEWEQDGNDLLDLECLDCVGNNTTENGHANGIFSLAGAIGFTSFMEGAADPKVVMFHSEDDGTVPYDSGEPFSDILWLVVGSDLPDVYGSLPMSLRADTISLDYEFYSYTNRGHAVHEQSNEVDLHTNIVPDIASWFFEEELKPVAEVIVGDAEVCETSLLQDYSISTENAHSYHWTIVGGSFNSMSTYSNEVNVLWDVNAPEHALSVIPTSMQDAVGDSLSLSINMLPEEDNTYLNVDADWHNPLNWSLARQPMGCDNVYISTPSDTLTITTSTSINRLVHSEGTVLKINEAASLNIYHKTAPQTPHAAVLDGQVINLGTMNIWKKQQGTEVKIGVESIENLGILRIGKEE